MKRVASNAVARWCAGHQKELQAYAGQYVAISSKRGIVAHGADFSRVHEEGIRQDPEAVFLLVPDAEVMVLWLR